jgi:hypothetical protein
MVKQRSAIDFVALGDTAGQGGPGGVGGPGGPGGEGGEQLSSMPRWTVGSRGSLRADQSGAAV